MKLLILLYCLGVISIVMAQKNASEIMEEIKPKLEEQLNMMEQEREYKQREFESGKTLLHLSPMLNGVLFTVDSFRDIASSDNNEIDKFQNNIVMDLIECVIKVVEETLETFEVYRLFVERERRKLSELENSNENYDYFIQKMNYDDEIANFEFKLNSDKSNSKQCYASLMLNAFNKLDMLKNELD